MKQLDPYPFLAKNVSTASREMLDGLGQYGPASTNGSYARVIVAGPEDRALKCTMGPQPEEHT